jgi:hypothetical protein
MAKPKTVRELPVVPNLENCEQYRVERDRLESLQKQLAECDYQVSNAGVIIKQHKAGVAALAQSLLKGGTLDGVTAERRNAEARIAEARDRLPILQEAVPLQEQAVQRVVIEQSKLVCDALRPAHRELVADIARLVYELLQANTREIKLRDAIGDSGYRSHLQPLVFGLVGDARDPQAAGWHFLRELGAAGYIDPPVVEDRSGDVYVRQAPASLESTLKSGDQAACPAGGGRNSYGPRAA